MNLKNILDGILFVFPDPPIPNIILVSFFVILNLFAVSEIFFLSMSIIGSLFTVSPIETLRKFCAAKIICWFFFFKQWILIYLFD